MLVCSSNTELKSGMCKQAGVRAAAQVAKALPTEAGAHSMGSRPSKLVSGVKDVLKSLHSIARGDGTSKAKDFYDAVHNVQFGHMKPDGKFHSHGLKELFYKHRATKDLLRERLKRGAVLGAGAAAIGGPLIYGAQKMYAPSQEKTAEFLGIPGLPDAARIGRERISELSADDAATLRKAYITRGTKGIPEVSSQQAVLGSVIGSAIGIAAGSVLPRYVARKVFRNTSGITPVTASFVGAIVGEDIGSRLGRNLALRRYSKADANNLRGQTKEAGIGAAIK